VHRLPIHHPGESRHYALRLARQPLRRLGYDIQRVAPNRRETLEQAFQQLWRIGIRPRTVFDVGVAGGTPELYETFPESHFVLVEALAENEEHMHRILSQVRGEYVLAAAASQSGTIDIKISPDADEHWNSTIFKTPDTEARGWLDHSIPAVRLDDLAEDRGLQGPFLVKVDVEGAELEVLKGAERVLEDSPAVVLEVTLIDFFEDGPRFADVVAFMAERGFVAYDIVGGFNRESDGALALVDMVFRRGRDG
jgi:FkbM family methyltransferase